MSADDGKDALGKGLYHQGTGPGQLVSSASGNVAFSNRTGGGWQFGVHHWMLAAVNRLSSMTSLHEAIKTSPFSIYRKPQST